MAKVVLNSNGKRIVLRNPSELSVRYARQLKQNKVSETGKKLSKEDRAFRIGYLKAREDNNKAYNAKKTKKKRKCYR